MDVNNMFRSQAILIGALFISACAAWPNPVVRGQCYDDVNARAKWFCFSKRSSDYEAGYVYCPVRYRTKHVGKEDVLSSSAIALAGKGYLYALSAAKVLHKDNDDGNDHLFGDDPRLVHVADLDQENWTGFQASVFELYDRPKGNLTKVIIAFRGSDQLRDWLMQNFGIPIQYASARSLTLKVYDMEKYRGLPIIVTGASLGGGLAVHVRNHKTTRNIVKEAWVFNPTIFDGIWFTKPDENTYVLYQEGEFLESFRGLFGVNYAPPENMAKYSLIDSGPVYAHFRYSVLLQILHAADVDHWCATRGKDISSPAMRILNKSKMRACDSKWKRLSINEEKMVRENLSRAEDPFAGCPKSL